MRAERPQAPYHLTHFTVTELRVTLWRKSGRVWRGALWDEGRRHRDIVSIWWKHVPSSHGPHTRLVHLLGTVGSLKIYRVAYLESIFGHKTHSSFLSRSSMSVVFTEHFVEMHDMASAEMHACLISQQCASSLR